MVFSQFGLGMLFFWGYIEGYRDKQNEIDSENEEWMREQLQKNRISNYRR